MSWLSEITSKAETFLNKIDQSAAITLNNELLTSEVQSEKNEPAFDNTFQPKEKPSISPIKSTFSAYDSRRIVPNILNLSADDKFSAANKHHDDILSQSNLIRSTSTPSLIKQDEMLFQFLNSSQPSEKRHQKSHSGSKVSVPHKTPALRKSSLTETFSSEVSQPSGSSQVTPDSFSKSMESTVTIGYSSPPVTISQDKHPNENNMAIYTTQTNEKHNDQCDIQNKERLSNLELENKLLKNELQVLNEELAVNLQRLQKQKDETEMYQKRYENRRNQQNEDYERIRREYEVREADMVEALKAKDSQLAVLRVRIQEVDSELKNKIQTLSAVESQNEKLLKDHKEAYGFHGDALQKLQLKLEETEQELNKKQQEYNDIKEELINIKTKHQSEQFQSTEIIKQLQAKQNDEKVKLREYDLKVKHLEETASFAQKELAEYKEKAARILQAKEKLISSLKQGTLTTDSQLMIHSELESLKQERDLLNEELRQSRYTIEQLRSEYHDLETVHNEGREENNDRIESLQISLQEEIVKRSNAEEDMKRYMQELQFARDEQHRAKKSNLALVQQHELEINRLQQQLIAKKNVSSTEEELENRLRSLTENLIHKQTTIEALGTEKNSLVLQLERLEKQYADVQNSLIKRSKANQQNEFDDLESGSHIAPISSVMPSQITRNQHWKKTVNQIDKISIQLGVFLRRYPAARLMVVVYMIILHVWVTFVLLTYTPEVHKDGQ